MQAKKYINSISSFQYFQLVRYSTLLLIGIVFTKTTLSSTDIGRYETFTFLAGAVSFFWLNGLLKALLPLASENQKHSIFSAFFSIQVFSLVAAALVFLLQSPFSALLLHNQQIPEISLLLVFIVFGVPANLTEYYYLIKKQNRAIIIYATLSFFIQFVLVVLPAVFGLGIKISLQGLVIAALLRYFWLWLVLIKNREIGVSLSFVKQHLKLGAPLVAAAFLSGSAQFVDGFIVTSRFSADTFAVFRYGARELPLAILLANALSNAMLPQFANKNNLTKNLKKLKKGVLRLMHLLFPLTAILLIVAHPVFPLVFNNNFAQSATIFNIYLLLITSRMLMPQTILNGLKITLPIMTASFFELAINITLSLIFVQYFGIAGIAAATVIAYLFEKIYLALIVYKKLQISIDSYLSIGWHLFYSVMVLIIFIFAELIFN